MSKPILQLNDWLPVRNSVAAWMSSLAGEQRVLAALGKLPSDFGDMNLQWLASALGTELAADQSSLTRWVARDFAGIRVFHGTRLQSPDELALGLRLLNAEQMRQLARERVGSLACEGATTLAIETAIADVPLDLREQRIFFCFDPDTLRHPPADHYLRYGSEYVKAVAIRVCSHAERRLESVGRPLLVTCDLLWDTFDTDSLHSVVRFLPFLVFEAAASGGNTVNLAGRGFSVSRNVPATQIASIEEVYGLRTFDQDERDREQSRRRMKTMLKANPHDAP